MRETSFRVWCKEKNEWEKDRCFVSQEGHLFHYARGGWIPLKLETHIIQFYTGLLDKNGKKIFEGDVLQICIDGYLQIYNYEVEDMRDLYFQFHRDDVYFRFQSVEIIGNVYENPELLEKK